MFCRGPSSLSPFFDLTPYPSLPLLSVARKATQRKTEKVRQLADRTGEGEGEGSNHTSSRKPDPLYYINTLWYYLIFVSSIGALVVCVLHGICCELSCYAMPVP
jgi:hypothetical protein